MITSGAPTEDRADPRAAFLRLLDPVLSYVAELRPASRTTVAAQAELKAALERTFPVGGALVQSIGRSFAQGITEGWLCNRGEPHARFSRVAKAGPETHGLSVDAVSLTGSALAHTHPHGEVTLGFAAPGSVAPRFDEQPPGWVFAGPGSTHTPTVTGGCMHLVYFLPDGAVLWNSAH